MPRRVLPALIAVVALAAGGCGGGSKDSGKKHGKGAKRQQRQQTNAAETPAPGECRRVSQPRPKRPQRLPKPTLKLNPKHTWRATVETSCGPFTITLDVEHAPKTAASFVYLARHGFFDGLTFDRIVPGFVAQGGDPLGSGRGGPGYSVVEQPPDSTQYRRGVVAMAKDEIEDPGTSGSQFFVVTGADAQLPPDYAVLGKVTAGQAVVDAIGVQPSDPAQMDRPTQPIVISRVTIRESK